MAQFPRMVLAELRKILTRASGWSGLAISALIPLGVVAVLAYLQHRQSEASAANPMVQAMLQVETYTALSWTLWARNFFVMPLILLMVTAQLVAGEWSDRTLRSLLWRPVSRWSVLLAKFAAICCYGALCLALTYLLALLPSLGLFGFEELDIGQVSLAYGVSWVSDAGLIALGVLVSTLAPSVVGVVVATVLFLLVEMGLRWGLMGLSLVGLVEDVSAIVDLMPGSAFEAWKGYAPEEPWNTTHFIGLAVLIVGCLGSAVAIFQRRDVP